MARKAQWIDTNVDETIGAGGQETQSLMGSFSVAEASGFTAVRTIIELTFLPPTAVSDGYQSCEFGIGVMSQEAVVGGVFPDPDTPTDRPARGWLYRGAVAVAGAASMSSHAPVHVSKDIRGSRKVDNGELMAIFDNNVIDGTFFSITVVGLIRVVFLYP